jgi:hypothetical protein
MLALPLIAFPFAHDPHYILKRPEPVSDASFHRGRYPEQLMDADEIIVHEVDRKRVNMILQFL